MEANRIGEFWCLERGVALFLINSGSGYRGSFVGMAERRITQIQEKEQRS
jgi:hypothetical protein